MALKYRRKPDHHWQLMDEDLTLRDENRHRCLIKRTSSPIYKTFEGYIYANVKFPPAFSWECLEGLEFFSGQKNLVLYRSVRVENTHMAVAAGVKACNLVYKTKFYTVIELVLKPAKAHKKTGHWRGSCVIVLP